VASSTPALRPDFLANGVYSASPRTLDQFVVGGKTIKFQPDGLVFQEAPSKLVGANGADQQFLTAPFKL